MMPSLSLLLALLFSPFLVEVLAGESAVPLSKGERQVDAKLSPSLQTIADVPGLPRVLLIGDSISMGYTLRVRALLQGRANVHRAPTNCGPTTKGLAEIDRWLGEGRWDVIHFNFGLHDLKFVKPGMQLVPEAEYEANLRTLIARLERTGARLVWATTTPVPPKTKPGQFPRRPYDIARYNTAARHAIAGHDIRINDLYSLVEPRLGELQSPMDVHFNSKGSDVLAAQVATAIASALPSPSSP